MLLGRGWGGFPSSVSRCSGFGMGRLRSPQEDESLKSDAVRVGVKLRVRNRVRIRVRCQGSGPPDYLLAVAFIILIYTFNLNQNRTASTALTGFCIMASGRPDNFCVANAK